MFRAIVLIHRASGGLRIVVYCKDVVSFLLNTLTHTQTSGIVKFNYIYFSFVFFYLCTILISVNQKGGVPI